MKNAKVRKTLAKLLSGFSAAVTIFTMMSVQAGAVNYYYPDDSSAEVSDSDIFRPLNAVYVSGGGTVNPDADTDMEYSVLNNTPDIIYITEARCGELQQYFGNRWETIREGKYDRSRTIELSGFEGYEDTADIKGIYGDLPDGDYRIVIRSSNNLNGIFSENYLEFSVKHTIAFIPDLHDLVLPMNDSFEFYISNNAPFDINAYYDDSIRLSRRENGKWVSIPQKDVAERYYLVSRVKSEKTNFVKIPLNTFFNFEKGGHYRLSIDWMCYDEYNIPNGYEGPISGIIEAEFDVTAPISAEIVPSASFNNASPELKIKITNNTAKRLTIRNFGRVQIKMKNGQWGYLAFKNKSITASDIDTRLVLSPGESAVGTIKLNDYYNRRDILSSTCRAEIKYGSFTVYCNFSVKSGSGCFVS